MLEVAIDVALVRRLIAEQFPHWKNLAVRPVDFGGCHNRTFHLGDEMTVRWPSARRLFPASGKGAQLAAEIGAAVAAAHTRTAGNGRSGRELSLAMVRVWLDRGETAKRERIANLSEFAADLARFLAALKCMDATDGPAPGQHNFFRGGPLTV